MMPLLLDTHAFLWWLDGGPGLSVTARTAIAGDPRVHVSAASAWEIATKFHLGKLPGAAAVAADIAGCVQGQRFLDLPIVTDDAQLAGSLPRHHRDPFDRMLVAQAIRRGLLLVSNETLFDAYGVARLW
jgi:PIN domain nuclease of toxin-antitoxin system